MADSGILVARESVMFDFEGRRVFIREGTTTVRAGHPVLKGHEGLFIPLVPTFELPDAAEKTPPQRAAKT